MQSRFLKTQGNFTANLLSSEIVVYKLQNIKNNSIDSGAQKKSTSVIKKMIYSFTPQVMRFLSLEATSIDLSNTANKIPG